jgi:hypothetical protein
VDGKSVKVCAKCIKTSVKNGKDLKDMI